MFARCTNCENNDNYSLQSLYSTEVQAPLSNTPVVGMWLNSPEHFWPGEVSTVFVNFHFWALELIQLLTNGCFVLGCKSRPGFISTAIILVGLSYLNIVIKSDDLKHNQKLPFISYHYKVAYVSTSKKSHKIFCIFLSEEMGCMAYSQARGVSGKRQSLLIYLLFWSSGKDGLTSFESQNRCSWLHPRYCTWNMLTYAHTFFSFNSSTVGLKLNFLSNIRFFSSFIFFSSAALCSATRNITNFASIKKYSEKKH